MTDIVHAIRSRTLPVGGTFELMDEAAAEIERLTATLQQPDQVGYWQRKYEIAAGEIERLRAALRYIAVNAEVLGVSHCLQYARAELGDYQQTDK